MLYSPDLPPSLARHHAARPARVRRPWLLGWPLFGLLLLVGGGLVLAAGWLAGHYDLAIGAPAERLYLRDGFDGLETRPDGQPFRWTHPLAQVTLPHAGPGALTIDLTLFDGAPAPRALRVRLDGQVVYQGQTQPGGTPWRLALPAHAETDTPLLTIETAPWTPPGDRRVLGVAITHLALAAPDAALRTGLAEGALVVAVLVLVLAGAGGLSAEPPSPLPATAAAVAGLGVLGFAGPLLAYGDVWLSRAAPAILGLSLLAVGAIGIGRRARAGPAPAAESAPGALPAPARALPAAAWGALALAALLLLLTLGRFNTGDAEGMFQVTAGLAEDGVPWQHQSHAWIKFGLGQPLATLPLYWLGRAVAAVAPADREPLTRFGVALFNQLVIPATALVLFWGARRRYGAGVALALTGTFLLATPAIAYARLAFAEPLSGLLILGGWLLLWTAGGPQRLNAAAVGAGLCLGLAVLVKPANAIYLPVMAAYLAWTVGAAGGWPGTRAAGRGIAGRLACWCLGLLPGVALTLGYNLLRYGSPVAFGYQGEGFTTPLLVGLYGLLVSPGKGLIFFAPPVLLAPLGLAAFWRSGRPRLRAEAVCIAVQAGIVLVFYAGWWSWSGNIAWGPRLILPLVPLLLWPLGALAASAWRRRAWWLLGAAGWLVAIPGALVDQFYYFDINNIYVSGTAAETHMFFTPEWSQIVAHWRFLLTGTREAILRPTLASMGLPAGWDTMVPVALAAVALLALVLALRAARR